MDIKSFIKNYKIRSFYISRNKNKKTLFARELDRILLSVLIFTILNIVFILRLNNVYISLFFSLIFTVFLYIILRIKEKKDIKNAKKITKERIVEEIIYNDLINKSIEKFQDFFILFFKEIGFDIKDKVKDEELYIEIYKDNIKIGISLIQYSKNYLVNENIIRNFAMKLKKNDINKGIIITTSDFTEESMALVNRLEKYKKINLINMKDIIHMIEGTKIFPKEKEIESYILNRININTKSIKKEVKNIISINKWKKYLITSLSIWIFGQFTNFNIYYSIISIILFSLALVCLIKKIMCYFCEDNKEETKCSYDFIYKD